MQTTQRTVVTKSGATAEVAITTATTDTGERLFLVQVVSGPLIHVTDIAAWEIAPARVEPVAPRSQESRTAVEHISQIVAEPMADADLPSGDVR